MGRKGWIFFFQAIFILKRATRQNIREEEKVFIITLRCGISCVCDSVSYDGNILTCSFFSSSKCQPISFICFLFECPMRRQNLCYSYSYFIVILCAWKEMCVVDGRASWVRYYLSPVKRTKRLFYSSDRFDLKEAT